VATVILTQILNIGFHSNSWKVSKETFRSRRHAGALLKMHSQFIFHANKAQPKSGQLSIPGVPEYENVDYQSCWRLDGIININFKNLLKKDFSA
jgi:hypothetical protein